MKNTLVYNRGLMYFMLSRSSTAFLLLTIAVVMMSGCTGLQTFSQAAHPGETIVMAIHRQDIRKGQATIIIEDSTGYSQSFTGLDPRVRGWINVYPDPVSLLLVGRETTQGMGSNASAFGWALEDQTNSEKDIYETNVFMDLPTDLASGIATIDVLYQGVSILPQPIQVDVLEGTGSPHPFDINEQSGGLTTSQFRNMERGKHYTVTFSGNEVPEAIELDFIHDPDRENGGAGQAYVVNPRGDIKNIAWTDTGAAMKVIIMSAWHKTAEDIAVEVNYPPVVNSPDFERFKFYVAGDISGLQLTGLNAYDSNGNSISGVNANVAYSAE